MTVEMNPCSLALKESARDVLEKELLGWGKVLQNWIPGNPKPKQLPTLLEGVEIYMVLGEVRRCTSRIAVAPFVFIGVEGVGVCFGHDLQVDISLNSL